MKKLKKLMSDLLDYVIPLTHFPLHPKQQGCRIFEFHSISDDFSGKMLILSPVAFQRFMEYNLFLAGRNEMHKYNNQNYSMLLSMIAVDNIANGIKNKENIWKVNAEREYHEEN